MRPRYGWSRLGIVLAVVACVLSLSVCVQSAEPTDVFPLSEVRRGMHGVGKTVFAGTQVEEFPVEVLGVVRGQSPSQQLVLVRASGSLIERAGGIAAGMSGSPVYIDGKLLGAVAYGFNFADHSVGLVTPAVDLWQLLDSVTGSGRSAAIQPGALLEQQPEAQSHAAEVPEQLQAAIRAAMKPVATPLMVSGLGNRTRALVEPALRSWNVMTVPAGAGVPQPPGDERLEPGSAFCVQLMRGDVEMTVLGTVTLVTEQGFVGMGHPFLNRGAVDFFVTGAYIHDVVQSMQAPFKIGAPTDVVGRLAADRSAGVAGVFNESPQYLAVEVNAHDLSSNKESQFSVQIIHDESLTVPLTAIALLEALDRSIDRIGSGTAAVRATLEADGLAGPVSRDNLFFSSTDISAASLGELLWGIQQLLSNEFARLQLRKLTFDVNIAAERHTARIERAAVKTQKAAPGDTVAVEVTLRPFRAEPVVKTVNLTIPKDVAPGEVVIAVHGGGYGAFRLPVNEVAAQLAQQADTAEEEETEVLTAVASLEKLIENLFNSDRNYELVVEFLPPDEAAMLTGAPGEASSPGEAPAETGSAQGEPAQPAERTATAAMAQPVKAKVATGYVVQGSAAVTLTITAPAGNAPAEAGTNDNAG